MNELPFLLRLVDDPSPAVATKVAARLRTLGPDLWRHINAQNIALSNAQRMALETLLLDAPAFVPFDGLSHLWDEWHGLEVIGEEALYLERALWALASWQEGAPVGKRGGELLDRLASEFRAFGDTSDAFALAGFLFDFCGLRGAAPADFYNPRNSNLLAVLEEGVGLPISLSCVFILVGARLGLQIEGCNFPGHFLARDGRRQTLFDPYNRGRMLSAREVATLRKAAPSEMLVRATSPDIIARVLRNLSVAYHHRDEADNAVLMLSLLSSMD